LTACEPSSYRGRGREGRHPRRPQIGEGWINGGFFVLEPEVFRYIDGDESSLELDALERLAKERQLAAFRHEGFWQCMDTLRDKRLLERLWNTGSPPWKVWP
jgi:glucose-1-phosphate cytidylyltransferase